MKNKNPLTESFLVQLDVDLDGTGICALDDKSVTNNPAHTMLVRPSYSSFDSQAMLTYLFLEKLLQRRCC